VATSTPLGLADSSAARGADTCQRTIAQSTLAFTRGTLVALTRCTNAIQLCIQTKPDDVTCVPKARGLCVKANGAIANATAKMAAGVQRHCTDVAHVMDALGLGYADLAADCSAHGDPANDIGGLATCIAKRHRCSAENLFQLEVPRAWELLQLADVGLPVGSCLTRRGGTGAHVASADSKALIKCATSISKAATAFLGARAAALSDCAASLFGCVQRKQAPADFTKCLGKADAVCARATDPGTDDTNLRAAIDAHCSDALIPFATLRAAPAANLDGVSGECAAQGVASLASLALFEECVAHQHECLAGELVRTAIPRAPALLALVVRALAPADCPPPGGVAPQ
jgi:hypothetical protein